MGAKQSKRSVDISGKEAESAGEVAAAGAGGEGRVEQLADADALKPQLNGDAHIQPPHEQSEKEKQLDSGTPENEKDATTEKEGKVENEKEKESVPVTNGEGEVKGENGDSTPTPDEGKKPKKEKVKKKWSLRSISFSRKDKPKQEKKQKEEEPKTNGEPEKVPEEAAEATPETVENKVEEEVKSETEIKDEKTPETPVTEPITNGSSTPESPKVETPATVELSTTRPENDKPEPKVETEPEHLPVNGLSLEEELNKEIPVLAQSEENKSEKLTADTTETVPAPEIPVKTEVCVDQMPLIETTPPPLPANPPPSSVVSFAATTMAPELTDASLANTAEIAISTPPAIPDAKANNLIKELIEPQITQTNNEIVTTEIPTLLKEISEEKPVDSVTKEPELSVTADTTTAAVDISVPDQESNKPIQSDIVVTSENEIEFKETKDTEISEKTGKNVPNLHENSLPLEIVSSTEPNENINEPIQNGIKIPHENQVDIDKLTKNDLIVNCDELPETPKSTADLSDAVDDLPPPPPPIEDDILTPKDVSNIDEKVDATVQDKTEVSHETKGSVNSNHIPDKIETDDDKEVLYGNDNETENENFKNKNKDSLGNVIETIECNGNIDDDRLVTKEETEAPPLAYDANESGKGTSTPEDSTPPSLSEANESMLAAGASNDASESFPPPPSELCRSEEATAPASPEPTADAPTPQDPLPASDKMTDLIAEVPSVPELLKTEMLQETTSDVAVAN